MLPVVHVLVKFKNWALVVHGPQAAWIPTTEMTPQGALTRPALAKIAQAAPNSAAQEIARHHAIVRAREQQIIDDACTRQFHADRRSTPSHTMTLTSDAKYSHQRICVFANQIRRPLFYGPDQRPARNQCQAEMNAAIKSLEIVDFLRTQLFPGGCRLCLTLNVDAESLLYSKSPRGYNTDLLRRAQQYDIGLNLNWIAGRNNPADRFTVGTGREVTLLTRPQRLKTLFVPAGPQITYQGAEL